MNLYLLFIIIISLPGIKIYFKKYNKNYLSKENTACIKGIFILIVFFSHLIGYIGRNLPNGEAMLSVRDYLGQLMVTLFLFYSGYGILKSINEKKNYVNNMPYKRIFKTLFNFVLAVLSFLILNLILGIHFDIKTILLSLIGWSGLGNSNWYIFGILNLYIFTYISFKFFESDKQLKKPIILTWVLTIIFILFMSMNKSDYWFNTLICYPLGISYAYHKEEIEKYVMRTNVSYIIFLLISIWSFLIFKDYATNGFEYYELLSMIFCLIVVGISMKINLKSKVLKWFGDNLFWVYILQRLPMMYLSKIGFNSHPYKFTVISFLVTIILTIIYKFLATKLFNYLTIGIDKTKYYLKKLK